MSPTASRPPRTRITYVEWSYAKDNNLGIAQIDNGARPGRADRRVRRQGGRRRQGRRHRATTCASSSTTPPRSAGAYPIVLVTYEIVCSKGLAAEKTALVKAFLTLLRLAPTPRAALEEIGYAPLPDEVRTKVDAAIEALSLTDHAERPEPLLGRRCPAQHAAEQARQPRDTTPHAPPDAPRGATMSTVPASDRRRAARPRRPSTSLHRRRRGTGRLGDRLFAGAGQGCRRLRHRPRRAGRRLPALAGDPGAADNKVNFLTSGSGAGDDAPTCGSASRRCSGPPSLISTIAHAASRCRSRSAWRCSSPSTRRGGWPARSRYAGRPAGRGAVDHLRPLGHQGPRPGHRRAGSSGTASTDALGWIPLFADAGVSAGHGVPVVGIVLAIMILPIVTAHQPRGVRPDAADAQGGARSPSAPPSGR